jgi:putative addiction module CopG family antidote
MNINLTSQLKKWCDRRLHWLYTSASEVVREALRLMEEKDQVRAAKLEQLRNDIQEGVTAVRLRLGMRRISNGPAGRRGGGPLPIASYSSAGGKRFCP